MKLHRLHETRIILCGIIGQPTLKVYGIFSERKTEKKPGGWSHRNSQSLIFMCSNLYNVLIIWG